QRWPHGRVRAVPTAAAPALTVVIHSAMACQRPHIMQRKDCRFIRCQRRQRHVTKKLPVHSMEMDHIGFLESWYMFDAERPNTVHVVEPEAQRHVTEHTFRKRGAWNSHGGRLRRTATHDTRVNASFLQAVVQVIHDNRSSPRIAVYPMHL